MKFFPELRSFEVKYYSIVTAPGTIYSKKLYNSFFGSCLSRSYFSTFCPKLYFKWLVFPGMINDSRLLSSARQEITVSIKYSTF